MNMCIPSINKSKLLDKLYMHIVKKPYLLILSMLIGIILFLLIAINAYKGVYIEIEDAVLNNSKGNEYEIIATINHNLEVDIKENQQVLWYLSEEDVRYTGTVKEIKRLSQNNNIQSKLIIVIIPNDQGLKRAFKDNLDIEHKVIVEIMVDKRKFINFYARNKENN